MAIKRELISIRLVSKSENSSNGFQGQTITLHFFSTRHFFAIATRLRHEISRCEVFLENVNKLSGEKFFLCLNFGCVHLK